MRILQVHERLEILRLSKDLGPTDVARIFNNNHPERVLPLSQSTVSRLLKKLDETGSILVKKRASGYSRIDKREIVEYFDQNQHTTLNEASNRFGLAMSTISKILKEHDFHPYKIGFHNKLYLDDPVRRLEFCHAMQARLNVDPNFSRKILYSDESYYKVFGDAFNRQNFR